MDRRRFLERTTLVPAAAALGHTACAPGARETEDPDVARSGRPGRAIGLQLYTVREAMSASVDRTLARVAEIGYTEVEFAGYFGRAPARIAEALRREGLAAPAVHWDLDSLTGRLEDVLVSATVIGHRYVVLPWLPASERESLDRYRALADRLNQIGARCRDAGIRLAYHNHAFEFERLEGQVPFETLLERTDPGVVDFEIDLYWVVEGGADPIAYFTSHPSRFELCHVKDRTAEGEMVDVGDGVIDFEAIFAHEGAAGLAHYFVEHDRPADPLASARASFRHLSATLGGGTGPA